jgi:hypothetical protein
LLLLALLLLLLPLLQDRGTLLRQHLHAFLPPCFTALALFTLLISLRLRALDIRPAAVFRLCPLWLWLRLRTRLLCHLCTLLRQYLHRFGAPCFCALTLRPLFRR